VRVTRVAHPFASLSRNRGTQNTTYTYDVLGNLIAATLSNGTKITYLIDAENNRVGSNWIGSSRKLSYSQVNGNWGQVSIV
jgi:YD repeat-containing protein